MPENEWYASWFDTAYYHLLYQQRDYDEARVFVQNLIKRLNIPDHAIICDLACGNGRHSEVLASEGYQVVGLDLSENNIQRAKARKLNRAEFYVHDMRELYKPKCFDLVLNLFTSFGYFNTDEEHVRALDAMAQSLKSGGQVVIDYLNSPKVIRHLVKESSHERQGIHFEVKRSLDQGYIRKDIHIYDEDKSIRFKEKVRAFELDEFEQMLQEVGMRVVNVYGSYSLKEYDPEHSDRMIIHALKRD